MKVNAPSIIDIAQKANLAKSIKPDTAVNLGKVADLGKKALNGVKGSAAAETVAPNFTIKSNAVYEGIKESAAKLAEGNAKKSILGKAADFGKKAIAGAVAVGAAVVAGAKKLFKKAPVEKAAEGAAKTQKLSLKQKLAVNFTAARCMIANSKPVEFVKNLASKLPGVAKKAV